MSAANPLSYFATPYLLLITKCICLALQRIHGAQRRASDVQHNHRDLRAHLSPQPVPELGAL